MRTLMISLLAAVAIPSQLMAEQPTTELEALDDALPGTLINDPTRLDWQSFGAGLEVKAVKGEKYPVAKLQTAIRYPKQVQHFTRRVPMRRSQRRSKPTRTSLSPYMPAPFRPMARPDKA